MPAPFKILTTKTPYMSLSFCRRNEVNKQINSVACQSYNMEQVVQIFQKIELDTGSFLVIHPTEDSLIYEKNIKNYQITYSWKQNIKSYMNENEQNIFLENVNNQLNNLNKSNNIDYTTYLANVGNIPGFEFKEKNDIKYCLLLPIQIADIPNGEKKVSVTNIMILLYVFRKSEMIKDYQQLVFFITNTLIANSVFYLILIIISLLIIRYYSNRFSFFIELPIQSIIQQLKSLNQHLIQQNGKSSQDEAFVVFDNKYSIYRDYEHTCQELTNLEKYITNIKDIFNFNFNYSQTIDETTALFTWIKAIKHFQQIEDYKALGSILNNIANIHFNNRRYLEAINCFNQSIVCLEQEKCELLSGQQAEQECLDNHTENNNIKDLLYSSKKLSEGVQSNRQSSAKKKKVGLIPWIEKYFYKYSDGRSGSLSKLLVLKQAEKSLECLKFDRLFGYSQVLLSCSIDNQMECEILNQNKSQYQNQKKEYYHIILQDDEIETEQIKTSTSLSEVNNFKNIKQKRGKENDQSLLKEYFQVLKKLLHIAKNIDNDYNRYLLIYLEISKAYLIKKNIRKSQNYLELAYRSFLELYKRIKTSHFSVINRPSDQFYNQYLQCLDQILTKRYSNEEVNEDLNLNRSNCSPSRLNGRSFLNMSNQGNAKINSSFNCLNNTSSPNCQQIRKQSKGIQKSQLSLNSISPHLNPLSGIQPIIEDNMEYQEEIILKNQGSSISQQQQRSQGIFDISKREMPNQQSAEFNTIYVHLAKKQSSPGVLQTPTSNKNNQRRQSQLNGSFHQYFGNLQGYSPVGGNIVTDKNFFTNESLSYDNPINKIYMLNHPTETYNDISRIDELMPINQTKSQLIVLDSAIEAFNNNNNTSNSDFWQQKTNYSYPLDVIYTKLQIQEALIELKKQNYLKGCTLLTDAFEFSPRYLAHDRMIIINILQCVFQKHSLDSKIFLKQSLKFNSIILKISIIVNCDSIYLKRVSKQLNDIYQLCDTFSLVIVNEQVEQYIAPINQSDYRGKEGFLNNMIKYLRFKHITMNQQYFLSALLKSSIQFLNVHRLENQEIQKKYILIFGDRDCIFNDGLYKNNIFKQLGQNKVKILIFNPQDDKEGSFLNLQCFELPFKIKFFFKFFQLIDYFKKKSIKSSCGQPFLIERI